MERKKYLGIFFDFMMDPEFGLKDEFLLQFPDNINIQCVGIDNNNIEDFTIIIDLKNI